MIRIEDYLARVHSVQTQYDYMRTAIKEFIVGKTAGVSEVITLHIDGVDEQTDDAFIQSLRRVFELRKGGFPDEKKDIENRLAQNEVILIVAVFEDIMKSIHREMLHQDPSLLNPERTVTLGRLAAMGEKAIIEEEIGRAVQSLDRLSVKDKEKAFAKLGLPCMAWVR